MAAIDPKTIGEIILAALVLGGGVTKIVSDKLVEEKDEDSAESKEDEAAAIPLVFTRKDLEDFIVTMREAQEEIRSNRAAERAGLSDALALMTMINQLIRSMSSNLECLLDAQESVNEFLRHADFPNRSLIVTHFELTMAEAVEEAREKWRKLI